MKPHTFVRLVALVLIAFGAGLASYGVVIDADEFRRPFGAPFLAYPGECVGWGIGLAVGGALLVVMFGRGPSSRG